MRNLADKGLISHLLAKSRHHGRPLRIEQRLGDHTALDLEEC